MNNYKTKKASEFTVDYKSMLNTMLTKPGVVSKCFSTFHNYSINNQFLAYWQMTMRNIEISPINSFGGWKKLNRSVNKGEKAIYLWQPIVKTKKEVDAEGKEVEHVISCHFRFAPHWFAYSQTNGKEVNMENLKINGFDFDAVYKKFDIEIIPFDKLNGNIQGFARVADKKLAINPMAEDLEMTILHEIAHIVLKHNEVKYSHDLKELEAEAVAYIVGSVLKLNETQLSNSRGYIQGYFKENEIPEKHAQNIMSTADKILKIGLKK